LIACRDRRHPAASLQLLAHGVKLVQLRLCSRWLLDPRADYQNWRRSALVVAERLIRSAIILIVSKEFDKLEKATAPAPYSHAGLEAAATLLGRVKTLLYGSGTYGAWWHAMLNPVPWLLEVPMLCLLVYFSLRDRVPNTAPVFDGSSAPVRWMEHAVWGLCRCGAAQRAARCEQGRAHAAAAPLCVHRRPAPLEAVR
jgi:hypothetical protein